jgi:DNA gyrase/topoisomerase IV subunit A
LTDDNQKIEPKWYIPIIPMVLVNGADSVWKDGKTKIPKYNPREIVQASPYVQERVAFLLDSRMADYLKCLNPILEFGPIDVHILA